LWAIPDLTYTPYSVSAESQDSCSACYEGSDSMRISLILILSAACAAVCLPAMAGVCGNHSPAFPVPECRNAGGFATGCPQPGAIRLWTDALRPGLPGQQLAAARDSTGWSTFEVPGADTGFELFQSVDVVNDHLYVAYNAGISVWDIAGVHTEVPIRQVSRDGWRGDFLSFPAVGENDFYIDDIDAMAVDNKVVIGVSGKDTTGITLWEHTPSPTALRQLYQDLDNDSRQVRLAKVGATIYAVAAGSGGVFLYDVSQARNIAAPGCLDESGSVCPGIYRGELGNFFIAHYLDVIQRDGTLYVVASGGNGIQVEIWGVANPSSPGTGTRRFAGLPNGAQGLSFFEQGGHFFLAAVARTGVSWELRIFQVDHCLDADGCTSLGTAVYTRPLPTNAVVRFLTYSKSHDRPYLYYGVEGFEIEGAKAELLLDLSAFPGQVTEITDGGGTYFDACSGHNVDYWGDYYPRQYQRPAAHAATDRQVQRLLFLPRGLRHPRRPRPPGRGVAGRDLLRRLRVRRHVELVVDRSVRRGAQSSSEREKKNASSMAAFSAESEPWMALRSMSVP